MPTAPTSILLLHGLGGSGEGSVKLLEQTLRKRGWNHTVYHRPTLMMVHESLPERPLEQRFRQAVQELDTFLAGRVPHLTLGFSFGGLLAPSQRRMAVCSPWHRLPAEVISMASARPGLAVLNGECDTEVPADLSFQALPENVSGTLDLEGTHFFDDWMDRIAVWAQATWERPNGDS